MILDGKPQKAYTNIGTHPGPRLDPLFPGAPEGLLLAEAAPRSESEERILSRALVDTMARSIGNHLGQVNDQIDALADPLWSKSAGGWPAWQHLLHAISVADLFVPGPLAAPPAGVAPDALKLKAVGGAAPPREAAKAYLGAVRQKVDAYVKSLSDDDLLKPNQALPPLGLDWNNLFTLGVLASHTAYHVGHGDALLRLEGLPGVF
jgi:hypothetical protein